MSLKEKIIELAIMQGRGNTVNIELFEDEIDNAVQELKQLIRNNNWIGQFKQLGLNGEMKEVEGVQWIKTNEVMKLINEVFGVEE